MAKFGKSGKFRGRFNICTTIKQDGIKNKNLELNILMRTNVGFQKLLLPSIKCLIC